MLTLVNCLTKLSYHDELVSGTLRAAIAAAFMTMSLTEIFDEELAFNFTLRAKSLSTFTETVT